jgi:catechol 2,3-dioxygenase-like lactoylglutathione lyase family enzyme
MALPAIIAPVSRVLAVTDVSRSTAFYRDVLGFEVREAAERRGVPIGAELLSGPARLEIRVADTAADSTGQDRPRGAAMLFFETADAAAMRAAVLARGGNATGLEKVNWLKMQMFQLQDPDGHIIWFGQSFQQPDPAKDPRRQLRRTLPELPLSDIEAGVAHYQDILGFRINYAQGDLGVMDRDDVTLLLIRRDERHGGIGSCYVYVRDADELHAELWARGAMVQGGPISQPWGLREFQVLDPEGNRLTFGQPFE